MEKEVALKEGVRNVRKNKAVLNTGNMGLQMAEGGALGSRRQRDRGEGSLE